MNYKHKTTKKVISYSVWMDLPLYEKDKYELTYDEVNGSSYSIKSREDDDISGVFDIAASLATMASVFSSDSDSSSSSTSSNDDSFGGFGGGDFGGGGAGDNW
jgi:uncharacterized membrane protein YgcG